MDIPPPGMVRHPGPNLHKPSDDRVYGRLYAPAPECRIPNHVQQIVGAISDEKPCLIGCKPMAARLVPSEGVPSLFHPEEDVISEGVSLFCGNMVWIFMRPDSQ